MKDPIVLGPKSVPLVFGNSHVGIYAWPSKVPQIMAYLLSMTQTPGRIQKVEPPNLDYVTPVVQNGKT